MSKEIEFECEKCGTTWKEKIEGEVLKNRYCFHCGVYGGQVRKEE